MKHLRRGCPLIIIIRYGFSVNEYVGPVPTLICGLRLAIGTCPQHCGTLSLSLVFVFVNWKLANWLPLGNIHSSFGFFAAFCFQVRNLYECTLQTDAGTGVLAKPIMRPVRSPA